MDAQPAGHRALPLPQKRYTARKSTSCSQPRAHHANSRFNRKQRPADLGPIIGSHSSVQRPIDVDIAGVDWYLNRRFLDASSRPPHQPRLGIRTAGLDIERHFRSKPTLFVTGGPLRETPRTLHRSDASIQQTVTVNGAAIGRLLTLSAWCISTRSSDRRSKLEGLYIEAHDGRRSKATTTFPSDNAVPISA